MCTIHSVLPQMSTIHSVLTWICTIHSVLTDHLRSPSSLWPQKSDPRSMCQPHVLSFSSLCSSLGSQVFSDMSNSIPASALAALFAWKSLPTYGPGACFLTAFQLLLSVVPSRHFPSHSYSLHYNFLPLLSILVIISPSSVRGNCFLAHSTWDIPDTQE